jgi:Na+/H+ antiporter NhaC
MEAGALRVVTIGMQSVAILKVVGMIIGTWIASGTVPYMILAGLQLLTPAWFLALALNKMPAIPALFAGAVAGGVIAILIQGTSLHEVFAYMQGGFKIESGIKEIDSLLNRGGKGYSTLNLSRAVEESCTLVSPLVPWNAGGVIVITALGLGVSDGNFENLVYIPLSFACWMPPVIGIVYAYLGWFSPMASAAEQQRWRDMGEAIQIIEPQSGARLQSGFATS